MALSLNKPSEGSVNWAQAVNDNWTAIESAVNAGALPSGYVQGMGLEYVSASTTRVKAGIARAVGNAADVSLTDDFVVDLSVNGAGGIDRKVLTAQGQWTNGQATLAMTADVTTVTELAPRSLGASITTSNGSATVTGAGFLSKVAVDDLIGNTSSGWRRVSSIESDSSLTVATNFGAGATATGAVIEGATVWPQASTPNVGDKRRIDEITAAGTQVTVSGGNWVSTSGGSNRAVWVGVEVSTQWLAAWVTSGADPVLSTQRTTPYVGGSGRRVGWVRNNSNGDIVEFTQDGAYQHKRYTWQNGDYNEVLNAGSDTNWHSFAVSSHVPPTSVQPIITAYFNNSNAASHFYLRPRGIGSTTVTRAAIYIGYVSSVFTVGCAPSAVRCDQAQWLQYAHLNANGVLYVDVFGWEEDL